MRYLTFWISVLFVGLLILVTKGTAVSEENAWPTPPKGWWESLSGGETAIFEWYMVSDVGKMKQKQVITIESVENSQITFKTQNFVGEDAISPHIRTVDVATDFQSVTGLPPGVKVEKGEETMIEVDGRSYNCTIYYIDINGNKMKVWHSSQLPPIFQKGNIKMEMETAENKTTIILTSYTGAFIE